MKLQGNNGVEWQLTAYSLFDGTPKKAAETAIKKSYKGIVHRRYRDNDYFRLSPEESGYDFFFSVVDWLLTKNVSDAQYFEEFEPGKVVSVTVRNSRPALFVTTSRENLTVADDVPVYYSLLGEVPSPLKTRDNAESIEALSSQLAPEDKNQYIPVTLFKSKSGKAKGRTALLAGAICFVVVGWALWPSDEGGNTIRNAVNPWAEYDDFLSGEASSVYFRLYQDALFQKAEKQSTLMSNWEITKVEHNKNSLTYHFSESESSEANGQAAYIRDIKRFIKTPEIQSLGQSVLRLDDGKVTLSMTGDVRRLKYQSDYTIPDNAMARFYLLADAIERYVPRAELIYAGKKPRSNGRWNVHVGKVVFKGAYLDDVVGVGSLMKDMPVSFGIESQEGVGTFDIAYKDGAALTSGTMLVTIFGEE